MLVIHTRSEDGTKAVLTNGSLTLQQVRVMYTRTALFFWFNVSQKFLIDIDVPPFMCKARNACAVLSLRRQLKLALMISLQMH